MVTRHPAVFDMAARRNHLEPADLPQRARGATNGVLDRVFDLAVICGPASDSTISEATVILTSPPLPAPAVELAICAPHSTVRLPALTVTEPPRPDCGPTVHPGLMPPMRSSGRTADPEARARMLQHVPRGRAGWVEEVAHAVLFLASDEASYITGAELYVDGGSLAT